MPPFSSRRAPRLIPVQGNPLLRRFMGFGGPAARAGIDGESPMPDGSPGSHVNPYDESGEVWGTMPGEVGGVTAPPPLQNSGPTGAAQGVPAVDPTLPQQVPFGVSFAKWRNPNTFQSVPIIANTSSNVPVLSLNMGRSGLIIQNNSTATSPDIAPTFYVGFNAQAQVGLALAILPGGGGILFDIICPRDAIYITIGPSSGASVIVQGCVVQGTYAPI